MIQFPEIDLKSSKTRTLIFLFSVTLLFFNSLPTNLLISMLVVLFVFNQYDEIQTNIKDNIFTDEKNITINYNNRIDEILKKLKRYKKHNPESYRTAMYYWTHFSRLINILEDDTLYHFNPYYDKALLYLQESTNAFQSLGVSVKERKLIDGLKFHDLTNGKRMKEVTSLSKELFDEGFQILYALSIRLNKRWRENPSIYNKEIISDYPLPYDKKKSRYDFYL